MFQNLMEMIEKNALSVALQIHSLQVNLLERLGERCVTTEVKNLLHTFVECRQMKEKEFYNVVDNFYTTGLSYLETESTEDLPLSAPKSLSGLC